MRSLLLSIANHLLDLIQLRLDVAHAAVCLLALLLAILLVVAVDLLHLD